MPPPTLSPSDRYLAIVGAPHASQEWLDGYRANLVAAEKALLDRRAWLADIGSAARFYSDVSEVRAVAFAKRQIAIAELAISMRREADAVAAKARRVAA